jgi:hypothetical protein
MEQASGTVKTRNDDQFMCESQISDGAGNFLEYGSVIE